ncbi:GNAT family N-acetyltransferase [Vibrio vulnificus]|uniref:GNAT family N-acetyltransferase n=1 Tax=Vibrio vulnificus TaxID=672 RepID=UPI001A19991B|nr:GNAT family N-acetyltransferase [Vibrio vulnificus]WIL72921.1 GNAT family N-acetyltransferase [Vibrio vulnificus]HAS6046198.1 GNAT family N-acetyltransferase [Vibrio vulnificus]
MEIRYLQACESDGEILAEIRVSAMKQSLEAIGRFEPNRARNRFLDNYEFRDTTKIYANNTLVGFYAVSKDCDHLYLSHLYVLPEYQGNGIGVDAINRIKDLSITSCHTVKLGALRNSPANQFYLSQGFELTHEEEWDLYYEWKYC